MAENNMSGSQNFGFLRLLNQGVRKSDAPLLTQKWTRLKDLTTSMANETVYLRARVQSVRGKGKLAFWVIRDQTSTAQLVISIDAENNITKEMVNWCQSQVPPESVVDIEAQVLAVPTPLRGDLTHTDLELKALKVFCVSKSSNRLPVQYEDLSRPVGDADPTQGVITVDFDTRLNNRVLDLRTFANQGIFRMQAMTCQLFREFLMSENFIEIHSPKLIGGASESGSSVFTLDYFDQQACLAQSPQFYKQMALMGDMDRVFEIGPVFRAEKSFTNRHMCEFVGLDMEMTIKESYHEIIDVLDRMFRYIFEGLSTRCAEEIKYIQKQYGGVDFSWNKTETPKLDFTEMMTILRDQLNVSEIPQDLSEYDPGTEVEKILGQYVKEKYDTDFFMLLNYPSAVRPFYSMVSAENEKLSNSYDFFMRGNEIVSGAQRVHDVDILIENIEKKGVSIDDISVASYIESFRYGAFPHGGCGVGLERVVFLFLGLNSIKMSSLFPRDPKRLAP